MVELMNFLSQLRRKLAAHRLVAVACVAGLVVLVCGAIALGTTDSSTDVPPEATGSVATTIESSDLGSFEILRRSQTAADTVLPQDEVAFSGASGANLALARRVQGLSEGDAWVVPGKGSVCLIANGSASCTTNSAAADGKLVLISGSDKSPGVETVAGVVPDGVGTVSAHLSDGSSQSLAVHENVYLARVSGSVTGTSFNGPNGSATNTVAGPPADVTTQP
ncbi:MAG: hypothetical protein ABSG93_13670 [Solirubrobacteraceae bacterium]